MTAETSKKATGIAFTTIGLLVFGILVFWNTEPRARGHSLSTWLEVSGQMESDLSIEDSRAAINEIGERAIPVLLNKLQAKDPAWKEPLYRVYVKLPWQPFRFSWAGEEHVQAMHGFDCLGPKARNAIPRLTKLLYDTNSSFASGQALASIGNESLPILQAALTNTSAPVVKLAAINATSIASNLTVAVLPEMRLLKTHTNEQVASSAVVRLMCYAAKDEAEEVALDALQTGRPQVRKNALRYLTRARIDKTKTVPVLVRLLNDADPLFRRGLTNALRQIDPITAASVGIQTNMLRAGALGRGRPRVGSGGLPPPPARNN
jgi:HEAT repeat protein